jgi:cytochrome c-type biogenesis protein CcmE
MRYRILVVPILGAIVVLTGFLVYGNLNKNLVYYLSPAEAIAKKSANADGERFRLGGLVEEGSVVRAAGRTSFVVVDGDSRVPVVNEGSPAQLFQAGVGVVVEGVWRGDTFRSDTMMVKHDQEYRPPDSSGKRPVSEQRLR